MDPDQRRALGKQAEQQSFEFLVARGLSPVARNYHCRGGEIDLIMLDEDCLAFVEVRYRGTTSLINARSTVDSRKQRKIIRTAAMFVARNQRFRHHALRFDVMAAGPSATHEVEWIRDAFRPNSSTL